MENFKLLKIDLKDNNKLLENISLLMNNKNFRFAKKIKEYNTNNNINSIYLNKLMINYINIYKVVKYLLINSNGYLDYYNYNIFDFNLYNEIDLIHYITTYILFNFENDFNTISLNDFSFILIDKKDIKDFIKLNDNYKLSYNDIVIKSNDYYLFINPYENFSLNSCLEYNKINFENHNINIDLLNKKIDIFKYL